jgi:hypothetical protein
MLSIDKVWDEYANSDTMTARKHIDSRFEAFFLNTLPPGSHFVRATKVCDIRHFGKGSAVIDLDSNGFQHWIGLSKTHDNWKLTLDENDILQTLTQHWSRRQFGSIQYITANAMNAEQIALAKKFALAAQTLENIFGYSYSTGKLLRRLIT